MEFIPSGAFEGVLSSFGLFEECITIESPSVKWNSVRGKYCLAKVRLPFMNPTFPDAYDLELEARPPNSSFTVDLARLSAYGRKKALFEHLDVNFDELNNKLKLLQMINMLNGSHYRIGLCFPSTCSSAELQGAFNKCKCFSRCDHFCFCPLYCCKIQVLFLTFINHSDIFLLKESLFYQFMTAVSFLCHCFSFFSFCIGVSLIV